MSTPYTQAPPSYGAATPPKNSAQEPLLGSPAAGPSSGNAYFDHADDLPDDFKYGVSVAESAMEIRLAFVRKVYSILFVQILGTVLVTGVVSRNSSIINWVQSNSWIVFLTLIGSLVNLGVLYWKRHDHPANLFLLASFTAIEAFTVGIIVAFYETTIVLQALLITLGVFGGLTLYTLQSKRDFSGMGPYLFGGLFALLTTGLVGMFLPFGQTFELVYAIGGCLIFSGYVVYDTHLITARLSPDEYIFAAISLYLDFINLFINILRVLNNVENR
ncbi:glutamate binding protein [Exidia glandulosa HHB12029]|uniref:Glutamate binding protein n=1 Tax=Exidia glandulosa HHB12029 TaxID=1314781 RepID=A0A165N6C4_EXIGL|nr:glutamate binding protein [Exidia glandulosa HHB12029]